MNLKNYYKDISLRSRILFSNLFNKLLLLLGNIDYSFANIKYKEKCIYYETKKFKLSTFDYILKEKGIKHDTQFKWDKFINDIKKNGIKHNPIVIKVFEGYEFVPYLFDGFHRCKAIEELYGKDTEIDMDIYVHYNYLKNKKNLSKHVVSIFKERQKEIKRKEYSFTKPHTKNYK